jgi:hypothetical protein
VEKQTVKRNGMVVKLVDDPGKVAVVKKIGRGAIRAFRCRAIVERVEELGFAISTDAMRRLSDDVPGAVEVAQRGRRRKRLTRRKPRHSCVRCGAGRRLLE